MIHQPSSRVANDRVGHDSGADHAAFNRMLGTRAHRLIAAIGALPADQRAAVDLPMARSIAREQMRQQPLRRGRRATVQRAALAAVTYWRELAPRPVAEYKIIGTEERFGRAVADLVWCRLVDDLVFVDELKTGSSSLIPSDALRTQVRRLLAGGQATYAHTFVGVRVLSLSDPRGRFWIDPSGAWSRLGSEPCSLPAEAQR